MQLVTATDRLLLAAAGLAGCRLIYTSAFGGVVSMLPEMFRKVNGYSLQFFGWGGEDDDMGDRYSKHTRRSLLLLVCMFPVPVT